MLFVLVIKAFKCETVMLLTTEFFDEGPRNFDVLLAVMVYLHEDS
jgi:hypothetical protein